MSMENEQVEEVWRFRGRLPGKTVAVVGGTHGNERAGVLCVLGLLTKLISGELEIIAGELVLILGKAREDIG